MFKRKNRKKKSKWFDWAFVIFEAIGAFLEGVASIVFRFFD